MRILLVRGAVREREYGMKVSTRTLREGFAEDPVR